jgi:hypothetical protein
VNEKQNDMSNGRIWQANGQKEYKENLTFLNRFGDHVNVECILHVIIDINTCLHSDVDIILELWVL